ncbi:MAG: hypothetical protein H6Q73_1820 [Firmicutes bacterium]|nr:hypothetical protein [Bacillota bacterium]
MSFKHGIYVSEVSTSIVPPTSTDAGIPVVIGTAPINLGDDPNAVTNVPILCETYAEAVAALGYSTDWDNYTLCEFMYSHFQLFAVAPVVFINVLDPTSHITSISNASVTLSSGAATVEVAGILLDSLTVALTTGGTALTVDTDYTASFDDDGYVDIAYISGGAITSESATIYISYNKLDPSQVTYSDIIGGVSTSTGAYTGLELINHVYPLLRVVPGQICAPYWSTKPAVAAVMEAKAASINGIFKCIALVDIPTGTVTKYSAAPAWKEDNNYTYARQVVCWPKIKLDDYVFHMSTQVAGLIALLDSENDDIPYESPSNKSLEMDSLVLEDGTEVTLALDQANYLNGQGIVTALNWIGGWKLWGNRTGAYPNNTDPKDAFIAIRRMFDWQANEFIQTFWSKVDKPVNRVFIEAILDSENIRLNGLASRGYILGGRVEFLSTENATTDLEDGKITFHTYITPPTPAEEISDTLEYDTDYLSTLFSSSTSSS